MLNKMIKLIFKNLWLALVVLATIGGAFAFVQQLLASSDYRLTIFVKSQEKIIENKTGISALAVSFEGRRVEQLFATKISVTNTGKRALTKDFVYQPITIETVPPANILQVSPQHPDMRHTKNTITTGFDLLNPNESIDVLIYSDQPIKIQVSGKIREIPKIELADEVANPPAGVRLSTDGVGWLAGALVFLLLTIDAFFVVRSDPELGAVFSLLKSLPESGSIDKAQFLGELKRLYEIYYRSGPILFVTPDQLIESVSAKLSASSSIIEGRDIERVRVEAINHARFANLYSLRSGAIFFGPVVFGFCVLNLLFVLFR